MPIVFLCGQAGTGKSTIADIFASRFGFKPLAQADPLKSLTKQLFGFSDAELWGPSENRNQVVPLGELRWRADQDYLQRGDADKRTVVSSLAGGPLSGGAAQVLAAHVAALNPAAEGQAILPVCQTFMKSLQSFVADKQGLTARVVLQLLGTEVGRAIDQMIWTRAAFRKANELLDTGAPGVIITDGRFRSEVLAAKRAGAKAVLIRGPGVAPAGAAEHASETEILGIPPHFFDLVVENNKEAGVEVLTRYIDDVFVKLFPQSIFRSYRQSADIAGDEETVYFIEDLIEGPVGERVG